MTPNQKRLINSKSAQELFTYHPDLFYLLKKYKPRPEYSKIYGFRLFEADWSNKRIFTYYKLCANISEFKYHFKLAYKIAKKKGLLEKLKLTKPYGKENYTIHSLDSILKNCISNNICCIFDFRKKLPSQYQQAYQQEWIGDIREHFKKQLSLIFKNKTVLMNQVIESYPYMHRSNPDWMLKEYLNYFPQIEKELKSMCEKKLLSQVPSLENLQNQSKDNTFKELKQKYKGLSLKSKKFQNKILSKQKEYFFQGLCAPHISKTIKYSNKDIQNQANKFSYRHQFGVFSKGAYEAAIRRNILDKVCLHMKKSPDSFGEILSRKIFELYFQQSFPKSHPHWLLNPKTQKILELDGFNKELKIAFEVNGAPHWNPKFSNIKETKFKDKIKKELCKKEGITLYSIHYRNIKQLVSVLSKMFNIPQKVIYKEFNNLN